MSTDKKLELSEKDKEQLAGISKALSDAGVNNVRDASQMELFKTSDNSNSVNDLSADAKQQAALSAMSAKNQMDKLGVKQGEVIEEVPHSFHAVQPAQLRDQDAPTTEETWEIGK